MSGVNKVIILGHLGRDPEVRQLASGSSVCTFSVATSRRWKDKQGEARDETEWHNLVCYDMLAEIAARYLRKGSKCYFDGRLKTRKWQDKTGADRYTTEIVVEHLQLLDKQKREDDAAPKSAPAPKPADNLDDIPDDIPF
jgi:single-strand DNA-binding protein